MDLDPEAAMAIFQDLSNKGSPKGQLVSFPHTYFKSLSPNKHFYCVPSSEVKRILSYFYVVMVQ